MTNADINPEVRVKLVTTYNSVTNRYEVMHGERAFLTIARNPEDSILPIGNGDKLVVGKGLWVLMWGSIYVDNDMYLNDLIERNDIVISESKEL